LNNESLSVAVPHIQLIHPIQEDTRATESQTSAICPDFVSEYVLFDDPEKVLCCRFLKGESVNSTHLNHRVAAKSRRSRHRRAPGERQNSGADRAKQRRNRGKVGVE
jgi:hypothetical protein